MNKIKNNYKTKYMKNIFLNKIVLYVSAFIPMYFLIFIKTIVEIINGNLSFNVLNTFMLTFLVVLIVSGSVGLYYIINAKKTSKFEITVLTKQNITDEHFLSYFSLFVLFALTFELELVSYALIFILIIAIIGTVYIRNNLFHINPLLNILGYSFYDITYIKEGEEKPIVAKVFYKGKLNENKKFIYLECGNQDFTFLLKK